VSLTVKTDSEQASHESVFEIRDTDSGLVAIIAIHSTVLGPAAGGCRIWAYQNIGAAKQDAMRLSRAMSFKNAIAGLPFGGGKTAVMGPLPADTRTAQFLALGAAIESLQGRYITAEDVGSTPADMAVLGSVTRYVSGLRKSTQGVGGDPAPFTALGTFLGIEAAVRFKLKRSSLQGVRVAVQGVGGVGYHLCKLLHDAGCILTVADVQAAPIERCVQQFNARVVHPKEILFQDVDVLAPCALGAVLNEATIPRLRSGIVAGAANNQLSTSEDGQRLKARDILYAPDYVINAGGIISVAYEYLAERDAQIALAKIQGISSRLEYLFARAQREDRTTDAVAEQWATELMAAGSSSGQSRGS
jgi:leucine dehydrogenase